MSEANTKTIDNICALCISKGLPLRVGDGGRIVYCIIEDSLKSLEGPYRSRAYIDRDEKYVYHCIWKEK